MIRTILGDNKFWITEVRPLSNLIYGDCVYEEIDFDWAGISYENLIQGGVMIVQTDWHTNYQYRNYLQHVLGLHFINHAVWRNEWGNHPKDRLHQCYDDILIFSKGKDYKFYPDRIQVPKATAKTKLNPSGRETKTATAWIDDIVLTTTSLERVKKSDGHNIRWQKPLKLYDRIISPFTDKSDYILDPFMGSGSLGKWAWMNGRNYTGIEYEPEVYNLAIENIYSNLK